MVSIKYTEAELKVIFVLVKRAVEDTDAITIEYKLMLACLDKLRIKIIKRLITSRDHYTFTFERDQLLAFVLAYEKGVIYHHDNYIANVLRQTIESLDPKI